VVSSVGAPEKERDISRGQNLLASPFVFVAVAAEATLVLSPDTDSLAAAMFSLIFLGLAVLSFFIFTKSLKTWTHMFVPICYSASVVSLVIACGTPASGIGLVMLLSIVWTALYLEVWQSVIVVAVVVGSEFITSIVPVNLTDSIRLRRVFVYLLVSGLIVYAVHEVRNRLARISAQRELLSDNMQLTIGDLEESLRCASVLGHLVDMLNSCNSREEAYEVIDHAARSMFVTGGTICAFDSTQNQLETVCSWGEFPNDSEPFSTDDCWALRRGHDYESRDGEISCEHLRRSGEIHTLCRPLLAQGEVMGVLTISVPNSETHLASIVDIVDPLLQNALLFGEQISIWMANFNLREILRFQSIRDPLTNLFNRRFMEETLTREISKATRTRDEISVIEIDIDNFKAVNDEHGHAVGDSALTAIAGVILKLFRDSDVPCRSGGEEFTVVLPKCSWEDAFSRCQELQRRVAEVRISTPISRSPLRTPTLSIGIATSPEHGFTSETLLRSADLALYASKSGGRNRITRALPTIEKEPPEVNSLSRR
jgi:diguanylate cyclase (GGDEF)-like protein